MTSTLIRQAGPYTVTSNGTELLVNGSVAAGHMASKGMRRPNGETIMMLLDTGCIGAGGKPDQVSITQAEYRIHADLIATARAARAAAFAASPEGIAYLAQLAAEQAKAKWMRQAQ